VSRKTLAATLRRQGRAGVCPQRFAPATTFIDLAAPVPTDLVKRHFDTGELDRVWTSDITYLRTGEGWLYLCAVRDGCSRRVIGWAIDEHLRTDLVTSALSMAVAMRGELANTVVLHADRGCQYTSAQIGAFADRYNVARSVGRTGVCWDNAAAESFWATLKVEFYDRYRWPSRAAAKLAVGDWIERVYNRRRRHSALGIISPVEFERQLTQTAQAAWPRWPPNGTPQTFGSMRSPPASLQPIEITGRRGGRRGYAMIGKRLPLERRRGHGHAA
jgi:transposase InsO family protein